MISRPKTMSAALAALASAALLLSSCASPVANANDAAAAQTRTVTSEVKELTIPAEPKKALGMYTTDLDMLITLGIPLASQQPIRDSGYKGFPYFFDQKALEGITPFTNYPEFNFEAILKAQPDVILNGLGYEKDLDGKLSDIAPTYTFNGFDGSDWRTKFKTVAEAFGKTEQYQAWMDKYQAKVDDVKKRLAEAGKSDLVIGPVDYYEDQVSVSCYGTPCLVIKDLGLKISPLADGEGAKLSAEQLEQLKGIDAVITTEVPEKDGANPDAFAPLANNKLWTSLPFVANKQIFTYDLEMIYGSPSGQFALLEKIEKALLP
ncbi:ABC transporter substrate-binding protein [Paenarthrobacter sp. NPDC018779]|uniref:ABC transporter substrate-binding protein n=1 Tax=Paenarthrobacter sp. NPDC018779 TaxID=3364375 RepID=UPI0037C6E613